MMESILMEESTFTLMTFSILGVIGVAFAAELIYSKLQKGKHQETSKFEEKVVWKKAA